MPFVAGDTPSAWPGADVRLHLRDGVWTGVGDGTGRLRSRRVEVSAGGRGPSARPRSATLLLPAPGGGLAAADDLAPVIDLAAG